MEKAIAELNSKIKTLSFRLGKTDEIIEKSDEEALKRHKTSITNITSMVDTLKEAVEEKKIAKGESEETVREWSTEIGTKLVEADRQVKRIAEKLDEISADEKNRVNCFDFVKKLE